MSDHYYDLQGNPCHFIEKRGGGSRPTTIADARKNNWLPSCTTILKVLAKPQLQKWIIQQHVMAALTTPMRPNEPIDEFMERIMSVEATAETDKARDRGTALHDTIEKWFRGEIVDACDLPWILPAMQKLSKYGKPLKLEEVLIGDGYAGRVDLILQNPKEFWLWDYKTAKTLPDPQKGAWSEHVLQAAAYAAAFHKQVAASGLPIRTGNVYISTVTEGAFCICEHPDWHDAFQRGFWPLVVHWQHQNRYIPAQTNEIVA